MYFSFLALRQYLGLEIRNPRRCLIFLGEREEESSAAFFLNVLKMIWCYQMLPVPQHLWVATFYKTKQKYWINDRNRQQDEFILLGQLIKPAKILGFGDGKPLLIKDFFYHQGSPWIHRKLVFSDPVDIGLSVHPETNSKTSLSIDWRRISPRNTAQNYNSWLNIK